MKLLLLQEAKSRPMVAVLDDEGDGIFRVGQVGDVAVAGCVKASLTWCSAMCEKNSGLACCHMFKATAAANKLTLCESVIDDFWVLTEKVVGEEGAGGEGEGVEGGLAGVRVGAGMGVKMLGVDLGLVVKQWRRGWEQGKEGRGDA